MQKEMELLKIWKADAIEALADNERCIAAQMEMIKRMQGIISAVYDHLHESQVALLSFVDVKRELYEDINGKKHTKKANGCE